MNSTPSSLTPVIFLAFANALERGYLSQLKKESSQLRDILLPLDQKEQIKLVREESTNVADLRKLLTDFKDQIVIFHYGGHADGKHLAFEDQEGHAKGLAGLLSLQKNLKLVFLNGCATQNQALKYIEAGIPIVLATTQAILDTDATDFAQYFYDALVKKHNLLEAFQSAKGSLQTSSTKYHFKEEATIAYHRCVVFSSEMFSNEIPWKLYVNEEKKEVLEWKIPESINFSAFPDYAQIQEEINRLETTIKHLPEIQEVQDLRLGYIRDLAKAKEKEKIFKLKILQLAETFSRIETDTDRLNKAQGYFRIGKLNQVNAILKLDDLKADQAKLMVEAERLQQKTAALENQRKNNANEFLVKAQATYLDFDNANRFEEACELYKASIASYSFFENNFRFACFLLDHNALLLSEEYHHAALKDSEISENNKAQALLNLGWLYQQKNKYNKAKKYYKKAIRIFRQSLSLERDNFDRLISLVQALNHLGSLYQDLEGFEKALGCFNEANNLLELTSIPSQNDLVHIWERRAGLFNNLGILKSHQEKEEEALSFFHQALQLYELLIEEEPENYTADKARLLANLGAFLQRLGKTKEALQYHENALTLYEDLAKKNPYIYEEDLATVHINLGTYYLNEAPDKQKSITHVKTGMNLIQPLLKELPSLEAHYELGQTILAEWEN